MDRFALFGQFGDFSEAQSAFENARSVILMVMLFVTERVDSFHKEKVDFEEVKLTS
jgi:hypothetical protein